MDKKVRERRRSIHRERGRRRAGLAALAALVLIILVAFLVLRSSDVFAVKTIEATSLTHVSAETISQATEVAQGVSLLKIDLDEVRRSLLSVPYVKTVELHRRFPNTLEVVMTEREPAVGVRASNGSDWLVSVEGRILESKSDASLPMVTTDVQLAGSPGDYLPRFIVQALPVATIVADKTVVGDIPKATEIRVSAQGSLTVVLTGSIEVRLGDSSDLKQKLKVAAAIVQQYLRDGKTLLYVDVSVPEKAAVKDK
jgi:cell division protein FtsQ